MTNDLRAVLNLCEKTASWYGIEISGLDQRNHLNDTPLHTVCTWGDLDAVRCLVDAGAAVNATGDQGCTPLFNAVMGENVDVVEFLLQRGADVSIRSAELRSVLDYARNTRAPKAIVEALRRATSKP